MAPAAIYPDYQDVTLTHTALPTQTTAREGTSSLGARTRTQTETRMITLTILEDAPSATLQSVASFDWPSTTLEEKIPYIHGIIPGALRAQNLRWHSQPLHHQLAHPPSPQPPPPECEPFPTTITTAATATLGKASVHSKSTRQSNYPRPSAIVPPAAYSTQYQQDTLQQQPNHLHHAKSGRLYRAVQGMTNYELTYLPSGLKVLFVGVLAVVVLASAWTILVWLINFPPGTWSCWQRRDIRGEKKQKKKQKGKERRPTDKPSKAVSSATKSPFHYLQHNLPLDTRYTGEPAVELTQRPQHRIYNHRHQRTQDEQRSRGRNETYTEHRRTSSSPSAGLRFSIGPSPSPTNAQITQSPGISTVASPPNPFLHPPNDHLSPRVHAPEPVLNPRSSSEWLNERAAFFNSNNNNNTSGAESPAPSLQDHGSASSSYTWLDTADMEALEAGTAPLTGDGNRQGRTDSSSETSMLHRSLSWLDHGLGMMDGAVDKVVERVAKWTDDDGGDEPLLLPVASEKGFKVE